LRPDIIHFLYEYAPLIDEHNKARQSVLALEQRWLTKDPWFRSVITLLGMSIVDMYRMYRHYQMQVVGVEQDDVDVLQIITFTDWICAGLRPWKYKQKKPPKGALQSVSHMLERIRDEKTGDLTTPPTQQQQDKGRTIGNPVVRPCFMCRRYLNEQGSQTIRKTSYWCKDCRMPLCELSRKGLDGDNGGRDLTCCEEHQCSDNPIFGCNAPHKKGVAIPSNSITDLYIRRSMRSKKT